MDTVDQRYVRQKNSSDRKPWEDEILREVYAGRDAHAAKFGNDATKIYKDLVKKGQVSQSEGSQKGGIQPDVNKADRQVGDDANRREQEFYGKHEEEADS